MTARWGRCICTAGGRESAVASLDRPEKIEADAVTTIEPGRLSSYRWTICALLFVATTINYVDRQVLGILAPTLQRALHWTETDYGDIVSWFSLVYALGFLLAGRLLDWIGVRRGLGAAVVVWSAAAIGHAFARTAAGFSI